MARRNQDAELVRLLVKLARPGVSAAVQLGSVGQATLSAKAGKRPAMAGGDDAKAADIILCLAAGTRLKLSGVHPDVLLRAGRLGLVEPGRGGVVLSKAGRAWLKRHLAGGDPYQDQHRDLSQRTELQADGGEQRLIVNDAESPLAWLRTRKDKAGKPLLDSAQFAAGERLRSDYWFASMEPRVTANWGAYASGRAPRTAGNIAAGNVRDEQLAARERVRQALAAVGVELNGVLIDVCCELRGLEDVERYRNWPQRSGKLVLQLALSSLARHYGLISAAGASGQNQCASDGHRTSDGQGNHAPSRIGHWGTPDFKPRPLNSI